MHGREHREWVARCIAPVIEQVTVSGSGPGDEGRV